ncbi:MAG: hypothetical protein DRJ07_09580 [Bacteroidetes bacterium]|nr:MAG: hypothetical protein DRJ07_09580 [Bacteroidota bacterium]
MSKQLINDIMKWPIMSHFLFFLYVELILRLVEVNSKQSTVRYGFAKFACWELRTVLVPKS